MRFSAFLDEINFVFAFIMPSELSLLNLFQHPFRNHCLLLKGIWSPNQCHETVSLYSTGWFDVFIFTLRKLFCLSFLQCVETNWFFSPSLLWGITKMISGIIISPEIISHQCLETSLDRELELSVINLGLSNRIHSGNYL